MAQVPVRTFRLPDSEWEEIKAIAQAKGMSVSDFIKKSLEEQTRKDQTLLRQIRGAENSLVGAGMVCVGLALWAASWIGFLA